MAQAGTIGAAAGRGRTPSGGIAALARGMRPYWLVLPAVAFLLVFFVLPLVVMAGRSVTDPSPATYLRFFESPVYLHALLLTLWMSLVVTVVCLLLGYPYAYLMYRTRGVLHGVLTLVCLLPFWSSLLVRTYAWTILLRDTGVINTALLGLGVIDRPLPLMNAPLGAVIGMAHILLPFMVLPIYASMRKFEPDLALAASGLGAAPATGFQRVFLPLTVPGVIAGCLFVFILAVGFYITPAILGGRTAFFSLLIVMQINQLLDFGFGSALGMILLAVVLLTVGVGLRLVPLQGLVGRDR